jgi:UDP-glucose 4-epimerase
MLPTLDRVYVNEKARRLLGWRPKYDFARALESVGAGGNFLSPLMTAVGRKGYHPGQAVPV